jgi:hypothetical protein
MKKPSGGYPYAINTKRGPAYLIAWMPNNQANVCLLHDKPGPSPNIIIERSEIENEKGNE